MWPEYKSGGWPEYCANVKFDMDELSDIMPELEQQWPSLKMPNIAFWAHEWGRHGTCAISMFPSEHDFFQAVLKLHAKLDIAVCPIADRQLKTGPPQSILIPVSMYSTSCVFFRSTEVLQVTQLSPFLSISMHRLH